MQTAKILSIQVGLPKQLPNEANRDDSERHWYSGIFKHQVEGAVRVGLENLEGDGQADREHHGGNDRAVLAFSKLNYPRWESEIGRVLGPGSFGENLTVDSLTEDDVCLGDIWQVGNVRLEVSQPRLPCYKLSRRLSAEGLHLKIMDALAGGWYLRTLDEGSIQAGDTLSLAKRPHPDWTIRRGFR